MTEFRCNPVVYIAGNMKGYLHGEESGADGLAISEEWELQSHTVLPGIVNGFDEGLNLMMTKSHKNKLNCKTTTRQRPA